MIEKSSNPEPQTPTQPSRQKSIAEEAAELIRQRRAFLASQQHASTHPPASGGVGEKGHAHDLTDKTPLLLGIGTGGHDDFAGSDPPADVVSDSPTGIEFDIYDRAFETEIKRIRSDKKKGRARTYLTRLVGEQEVNKYAGDDCMVLDAGKSPTSNVSFRNSSAIGRGLNQLYEVKERWQHDSNGVEGKRGASEGVKEAVETVKEKGNRFADLVTAMRKDLKGQNSN